MKEVTATVVFAIDIKTTVGTSTSPAALREMILIEAEYKIRNTLPINAPIIVDCSDPIVNERDRFLKLGQGEKTLPHGVKPAPSNDRAKPKRATKSSVGRRHKYI